MERKNKEVNNGKKKAEQNKQKERTTDRKKEFKERAEVKKKKKKKGTNRGQKEGKKSRERKKERTDKSTNERTETGNGKQTNILCTSLDSHFLPPNPPPPPPPPNPFLFFLTYHPPILSRYRLVGLVVKASASRAEGPGFESRLRRDFFGVESYQ